jgi:ubiquinone/menaquinone biosynthesis C-methylase UbiE
MSSERNDTDIFRLADQMDEATLQTIADRLEFRASDSGYTQIAQTYFDDLPLDNARVLCLGCGTGVEVRALARLGLNSGALLGIDHSPKLIDVARKLTAEEGLDEAVRYEVGDAHELKLPDEEFDVVLLHTLVSHVNNPAQVLREARRVAKPGGTVAVFDGDYASITFGYPDIDVERSIEDALMRALIANPRVMRDMPRLLKEVDLELVTSRGYLYADIGGGSFWANVPQAYAGIVERTGELAKETIDTWKEYQSRAVSEGIFFGASSYYSFVSRRPA